MFFFKNISFTRFEATYEHEIHIYTKIFLLEPTLI